MPPTLGVGDEDRTQVAVDARVEEERAEHLGPVFDADGERSGEVADVGEALDVVGAATVAARRPLTVREHLRGRHKPQTSVAEERRRRRTQSLVAVDADGVWVPDGF